MRHSIFAKVVTGLVAVACISILSGCWWGRREPRHDDHGDHHEDHHDEHHDDRGEHHEDPHSK
jgi:hypothetical protein